MNNTDAKLTACAVVEAHLRRDGEALAALVEGLEPAELGGVVTALADMVTSTVVAVGRDPSDALQRWRAGLLGDQGG
jgi:hypothetical protein